MSLNRFTANGENQQKCSLAMYVTVLKITAYGTQIWYEDETWQTLTKLPRWKIHESRKRRAWNTPHLSMRSATGSAYCNIRRSRYARTSQRQTTVRTDAVWYSSRVGLDSTDSEPTSTTARPNSRTSASTCPCDAGFLSSNWKCRQRDYHEDKMELLCVLYSHSMHRESNCAKL